MLYWVCCVESSTVLPPSRLLPLFVVVLLRFNLWLSINFMKLFLLIDTHFLPGSQPTRHNDRIDFPGNPLGLWLFVAIQVLQRTTTTSDIFSRGLLCVAGSSHHRWQPSQSKDRVLKNINLQFMDGNASLLLHKSCGRSSFIRSLWVDMSSSSSASVFLCSCDYCQTTTSITTGLCCSPYRLRPNIYFMHSKSLVIQLLLW